jgi:hypothetical protein
VSVLDNDEVRTALHIAWQDSQPGTAEAHEEGGFVLLGEDEKLIVERWPRGDKNEIELPAHDQGRRAGLRIVASFHTHPNLGLDFQQEPSLNDIRAVRDDPDLAGPEFEGEFVIGGENVYRILKSGDVQIVGPTNTVLKVR